MYIIIDGKVDFMNNMEKYPLSIKEIQEIEQDLSVKDLTKQFQKYINQTGINEIKAKRQLRRAMTFKNASPFLDKLKSRLSTQMAGMVMTVNEKR